MTHPTGLIDELRKNILESARATLGDPYDPLTIAAKFDLRDAFKAYDDLVSGDKSGS